MKENEIAIKMQVEQEIESEKLESPKPLDSVCDFGEEGVKISGNLHQHKLANSSQKQMDSL